jgi:site-specific DNA recombinase
MQAVAYLRVSTQEQAQEGASLAAQEERIRAYCTMSRLNLVQVFREEGVSASKPLEDRPVGRGLVERLRSRQATHLVAMKLDRLFRDAVDCLTVTREWDAIGVTLHLVDMGGQCLNTGSAMGRMFLTMAAGFAELERNLTAERTSQAMAQRKAEGRHVGAPALGYQMVDGQLLPKEEETATVARVVELRQESLSLREIAAALEQEGYATKRGGKWAPSAVHKILARTQKP